MREPLSISASAVKKRLTLIVQPMQIFDYQQERAIDGFRQEKPRDGVQSPRLAQLRVHAGETILVIRNLKQSVQIREPVLQVRIERSDLGCDLLATRMNAVLADDVEIAMQELDNRQIGRALAV